MRGWRRARLPGRSSTRLKLGFAGTFAAAAIGAPLVLGALIGTEALGVFGDRTWSRIEGTWYTVFGDELQVDESSLGRVTIIEETLVGLSPFGQGMMAQELVMGQGYYPHLTYLHAFYDLGIAGGLAFFLLIFAVPAAILWQRFIAGDLDRNAMFVMLLFLYSQTDHLTHGAPYSWSLLVPALLAYVLIWRPEGLVPRPLTFRLRQAQPC